VTNRNDPNQRTTTSKSSPKSSPKASAKSSSQASLTASSQSSSKPSKAPRALPIVLDVDQLPVEETALAALWPEAVLVLSEDERKTRVRAGLDTVLLDEVVDGGARRTRGFVKVVLRVPLDHPRARVYGVFVEVDRDDYRTLQQAFRTKTAARVTGRLATRLPFLDDAYGTRVVVEEDGSDRRARVVDADSRSLREGPQVGPRGAQHIGGGARRR
jgi:hypothetical protein